MNAPVMNRAPISEGNLRVSSKTEATRLKGAILAKIGTEETFAVEAVGIKAIGSALKALAILGTPPRNPSFTPKKFQSSVVFKRGYSEQDDGKRLNFTIVSFEVQPKESQELSEAHIEANANTDLIVRVSRTTQVVALASKMAREFETDPTRSLYMHVMGPHAISTGMKALCVLKNMLAQSGIYNKAIFKPKFVRENGLSIVEIKVHLEQEGEEGEEGEGGEGGGQ